MANYRNPKTIIKLISVIFVFISIVGYAIFQGRNLINGPIITISSPKSGEVVKNPLISIDGSAQNISFISLNDRQIFVSKEGNFSEKLLLSPGYNIMRISATDKFGRKIEKIIDLVLDKKIESPILEMPITGTSTEIKATTTTIITATKMITS